MLYKSMDTKEPSKPEPENSLSTILYEIEKRLAKIKGSGADAIQLLTLMDEASERIDASQSGELKAEKAQFEYLVAGIAKNARPILSEIGGQKKLAEYRQKYNPDFSHGWWFLDQYLHEKRSRSIKRILIWTASVALALLILGVIYQKFFAPSPAVVGAMNHQRNAQDAILAGDPNSALAETNKALSYTPDDSSLLILKGIILQKLGRNLEADQIFQQEEKTIGSREKFLLVRVLLYVQADDTKSALADSQEIVKLDPNSAEGYYYMGLSYDSLKMFKQAIDAYNKAGDLADKQNKTVLQASIRMNLAMTLQEVQAGLLPTVQPTQSQ